MFLSWFCSILKSLTEQISHLPTTTTKRSLCRPTRRILLREGTDSTLFQTYDVFSQLYVQAPEPPKTNHNHTITQHTTTLPRILPWRPSFLYDITLFLRRLASRKARLNDRSSTVHRVLKLSHNTIDYVRLLSKYHIPRLDFLF